MKIKEYSIRLIPIIILFIIILLIHFRSEQISEDYLDEFIYEDIFIEEYLDYDINKYLREFKLYEDIIAKDILEKEDINILKKIAMGDGFASFYSNEFLARYFEEKENYGEAKKHYLKALEIYEDDIIKRDYGLLLYKNNDFKEAETILLETLPSILAFEKLIEMEIDISIILESIDEKSMWTALEQKTRLLLGLNQGEFLEEISYDDIDDLDVIIYYYTKALVYQSKNELALDAINFFNQNLLENTKLEDEKILEMNAWHGRRLELLGDIEGALNKYRKSGVHGNYRRGLIYIEEGREKEGAILLKNSLFDGGVFIGSKKLEELGYIEEAVEGYETIIAGDSNLVDDSSYRLYIILEENPELENKIKKEDLEEILTRSPAWANRLGLEYELDIDIEDQKYFEANKNLIMDTNNKLSTINSYSKELYNLEVNIINQRNNLIERYALANRYKEKENYFLAVRYSIPLLNDFKVEEVYELNYLMPYEKIVKKYSDKYDIDPFLIWAVMREESHYRSDAVSWVGARGLMQIMPATAKDISTNLGHDFNDEDLFNPDINIKFGSWYLKRQLDNNNGDFDKALASYNGGLGNVRRWEGNYFGKKEFGFPTAIDFPETREYITKVMDSYHFYKILYD